MTPRNDRYSDIMAPLDLRLRRATSLVALVMTVVGKRLPDYHYRNTVRDLLDELVAAGVEIITDDDRKKAGLPPRGDLGWTDHELTILEAKRIEAMLAPMPPIFISNEPRRA